MMQKAIDEIGKEDIENLIATRVGERRTLDYKSQLPAGGSDERREFLYDVASFANASGGDLIFGVADERDAAGKSTGFPASAEGVVLPNPSETILRLENLVRDGIDPRIAGIQWRQIDGFPKGPVLLMRIPKSWAGPHMVIVGGASRFYSRNSAGKYPLDVREIRSAFLAQAETGDRIRRFIVERLSRAMQNEAAMPLQKSILLIHLIPVSALDPTNAADVSKKAGSLQIDLQPISAGGWGARFNFDGVIVTGTPDNTYVQVFRSGIIEAAQGDLFLQREGFIPSVGLERSVFVAVARYLGAQKKLELPLPICLSVALAGVKGCRLAVDQMFAFSNYLNPVPLDRDVLILPDIFIEDFSTNVVTALRPAFDALWQACGLQESANYNEKGEWRPHG
jgi:hypothetical protein